jgi:hypothetical protein
LASRLSTIDELTRPDHTFLSVEDACHYIGEYTARVGYSFSVTNDLIQNLKKPMDRKGRPEWRHKERAIRTFGKNLREAVNEDFLRQATLIPVPPSKRPDHPDYDDRMMQILRIMAGTDQFDIREMITTRTNLEPAHLHENRRSVEALVEALQVNPALKTPSPVTIGVFDDVLTTGAHFVAMKRLLRELFPDVPICGIFLARRAPGALMV